MNPAPTGRSSPGRSRTAAGGTGVPPRRGSRSSPPPFPAAPSGRTSSSQLSPPSTMGRRAPKRPTGPRLPPAATSCSAWTITRSSRPATPSPSASSPDPGSASSWSSVSVPTLGSTPIVASTRSAATSSSGLATCRRARGVPSRSPDGHEPPAAALPQSIGRSPAGSAGHLTVTSRTTPARGRVGLRARPDPDGLELLLRQQITALCSKQSSGDAARSSTIILPKAVSTECLLQHGTFESGRGQRGVRNGGFARVLGVCALAERDSARQHGDCPGAAGLSAQCGVEAGAQVGEPFGGFVGEDQAQVPAAAGPPAIHRGGGGLGTGEQPPGCFPRE